MIAGCNDSRELASFLSEPSISTHKIRALGVGRAESNYSESRRSPVVSDRDTNVLIRISMGYVLLMIRSFKGKFAEPILQGRMVPKGFPANLAKVGSPKADYGGLHRLS
jgi:hypothetical protein